MKANKVFLTIKLESLSIEVVESLLMKVISEINGQYENGKLVADDGDTVEWITERKEVDF